MADTFTTNYNLIKPDTVKNALISDINGNMDLVDAALWGHPRGRIAKTVSTASSVGSTGSSIDILTIAANLLVTREYKITTSCMFLSSVAGDEVNYDLMDGAVVINSTIQRDLRSVNIGPPIVLSAILTAPSTGSHTFKGRFRRFAGTGSVQAYAASNAPAFLVIEDIGPA